MSEKLTNKKSIIKEGKKYYQPAESPPMIYIDPIPQSNAEVDHLLKNILGKSVHIYHHSVHSGNKHTLKVTFTWKPRMTASLLLKKLCQKQWQITQIYKPEVLGTASSRFDFFPEHLEAQKDDQHPLSMTSAEHIS